MNIINPDIITFLEENEASLTLSISPKEKTLTATLSHKEYNIRMKYEVLGNAFRYIGGLEIIGLVKLKNDFLERINLEKSIKNQQA